jgi:RNase P subunit RPR2
MKIVILCKKCGTPLKDIFSAEECKLSEGEYCFKMECLKCEKYVKLKIKAEEEDCD